MVLPLYVRKFYRIRVSLVFYFYKQYGTLFFSKAFNVFVSNPVKNAPAIHIICKNLFIIFLFQSFAVGQCTFSRELPNPHKLRTLLASSN